MAGQLVVVGGATGAQGSSVVDACLREGFKVRGLTRNPDSDKAKQLAARGVEVVRADFNDKPEALRAAYEGASAAFLMTDFSGGAMCDPERETQQAKNQADAAMAAGCKHLVFSTVPDPTKDLGDDVPLIAGKWKVQMLESKVHAEAYMRERGYPATFVIVGTFMEILTNWFAPRPKGDGTFAIRLPFAPDTKIPWMAAAEIGKAVAACFKEGPAKITGLTLHMYAQLASFREAAALLSAATGRTVVFEEQPDAECLAGMAAMGMPPDAAQSVVNSFKWQRLPRDHPMDAFKAIVPDASTLDQWVEANKGMLTGMLSAMA